jgi:hypothetical protein
MVNKILALKYSKLGLIKIRNRINKLGLEKDRIRDIINNIINNIIIDKYLIN